MKKKNTSSYENNGGLSSSSLLFHDDVLDMGRAFEWVGDVSLSSMGLIHLSVLVCLCFWMWSS
jgi:hypothetical protein